MSSKKERKSNVKKGERFSRKKKEHLNNADTRYKDGLKGYLNIDTRKVVGKHYET